MKQKVILALKIAPGEKPETIYLENTLEALQRAVSIGANYTGLIEVIDIDDGVCVIANEECKLINLPPNRKLGHDVICGVFYVVAYNDEGDFCSLNCDEIEKYKKMFEVPDKFENFNPERYLFAHFIPID